MKNRCPILMIMLAVTLQIFGQSPEQGAAAKGPEGVWQGTLEAGGAQLRLVLTITKSGAGGYSGKVDSLDQGSTIPIDTITVTGDAVRLELKSVGAAYEGALNKDRSEMSGKFTQGGATLPLVFKAGAPSQSDAAAKAPSAPPPRPLAVPFDVAVPVAPTAFKAGGKTHLVYELHATNLGRSDCVLTRLEVIGPGEKSLARYEGNELASILARPGAPPDVEKSKIGAGLRAIVYMWMTLEAGAEIPSSIHHRLSVKVGAFPEEIILDCARVAVGQKSLVIGSPLREGEWLAVNGPSNTSNHRRALIAVYGKAHMAQRFAIDWVRLREDGRTFTGDPKDNKNYRCYGVEALAVADAVVAGVKDGIPENVPGPTSRAVPITLETVGGNYVILDLGQGRYAFYAHLQPGSLRVKVGDKVRRGQTLGLVGNSGNSTEPHLHFHISDANSPLGADGLPYVLPTFEVQGKGWGWKPSGAQAATEKRQMELPLENEVVRFPDTP
ncbi:MAG TPA: M23 family metallopeptidase [Blastocatellia bacterium]|nr:M23 family metallopeptidase [Blastocatellia bacterium]